MIPFLSNFYLLRLTLCLDTPSFTSHPMTDRAMKHPMEESPEVVPARPHFRAMLQWDGEGSSAAPPSKSQSPLLAISDDDDGEVDDVLTLEEQLDIATSSLREESQEADQLCLFIAAMKWEMVAAELAATEAQVHLAGKAFGMI